MLQRIKTLRRLWHAAGVYCIPVRRLSGGAGSGGSDGGGGGARGGGARGGSRDASDGGDGGGDGGGSRGGDGHDVQSATKGIFTGVGHVEKAILVVVCVVYLLQRGARRR